MSADKSYDTIIRNGRWFDGTGAPSAVRTIGIRDGHVVALTRDDLDETGCPQVIDADGRAVFHNGWPTRLVGQQRTGRFLRAAHKAPAVTVQEGALASVG